MSKTIAKQRFPIAVQIVVMLLAMSGQAIADAQGAALNAPAASDTLSAALHSLPAQEWEGSRLLVTVAADEIKPPAPEAKSESPPLTEKLNTLADVSRRYNRALHAFGDISALPKTQMTALNLPSAFSLSSDTVGMTAALKIFLSMLTIDQLKQLSGAGLDLTSLSPEQSDFYSKVLARPISIIPNSEPNPFLANLSRENLHAAFQRYKEQIRPLPASALAGASRMHISLHASYLFSQPKGSGSLTVDTDPQTMASRSDFSLTGFTNPRFSPPKANSMLAQMKPMVDTTLKPGDLDWNRKELSGSLAPGQFQTVGDFIAAVARQSGLELYCDPHFSKRKLEFWGDAQRERPTIDLLQAITMSVYGAWRSVGPAYVLTNDLAGVGYRRAMIHEAIASALVSVKDRLAEADQILTDKNLRHILGFRRDDPLAIPIDLVHPDSQFGAAMVAKFGTMPPGLQEEMRKQLRAQVAQTPEKSSDPNDSSPFLRSQANGIAQSVNRDFSVEVALGGKASIDIPNIGSISLGQDEQILPQENTQDEPAEDDNAPSVAILPQHIGILASPASEEEARSLIDQMALSGMDTLYCAAFTNGITYYPSKNVPPTPEHQGVLQAAVDEGSRKGVAVYADLDLMQWNTASPRRETFDWRSLTTSDTTITGASTTHAVSISEPDINMEMMAILRQFTSLQQSGGWPSISDPRTRSILTGLTADAAGVPGLSGILFRHVCPPGYCDIYFTDAFRPIDLGYTDDMRLGYLRSHQQDPTDISRLQDKLFSLGVDGPAIRLQIPEYDDGVVDENCLAAWIGYRTKIEQSAMAEVFSSAKSAAPALPLMVQDSNLGATLYDWKDPQTIPGLGLTDGDLGAGEAVIIPVGAFSSSRKLTEFMKTMADGLSDQRKRANIVFDVNSIPTKRDLLDEVKWLGKEFERQSPQETAPASKSR